MDERNRSIPTAIIIAGGDPIEAGIVTSLPHDALTIAADSGLDQARRLGLTVDVVIGDMDSVAAATLDAARSAGVRVEAHPTDKDATDLDLAIAAAIREGAQRLILIGGKGGRLDHLLGNALLLADDRLAGVDVVWRLTDAEVAPVRPQRPLVISGSPGDIVSIIPVGGPAVSVHTSGLRWTLDGDTLPAGSTRGISNEMQQSSVSVRLGEGAALVIHQRNP